MAGGTGTDHPTVHPGRLLVGAGVFAAIYLALPWLIAGGATVSVWLLAGSALAGATIGALMGLREIERPAPRGGRRRSSRPAGAFVVATTGSALLLGRFLEVSSVPWVVLGCTALTTGAAARVWVAPHRADAR